MMERRRGIFLSRWTVGRYVKSWGLAVQKNMRRAWNAIRRGRGTGRKRGIPLPRCGQGGKRVHLAGGRGRLAPGPSGRNRPGRKRQNPAVKKAGKLFGRAMLSAITNQGDLRVMIFEKRFIPFVFLEFLERMVKPGPDTMPHRRPAFHAQAGWRTARMEKRPGRLALFLLPPYNPELNPDGDLEFEKQRPAKERAATRSGMTRAVRSFMRGRHTSRQ